MKIPIWQHKLPRHYKRGNLVSYFLNNAAKTCLYELKISENIATGHVFQSKAFFRLSGNLHTSCLSAFKYKKPTSPCNNGAPVLQKILYYYFGWREPTNIWIINIWQISSKLNVKDIGMSNTNELHGKRSTKRFWSIF